MLRILATLIGLLVSIGLVASLGAADPASKGAAFLEVRLPGNARLEVDGAPTRAKGETRWFRSPPLPAGKSFAYTLKASWQGKQAVRKVWVKADETVTVVFRPSHFTPAEAAEVLAKPAKPAVKKSPPVRDGFVLKEKDGRWWVFKAESKELEEFQKNGELAKHVTRINAAPLGITIKAPDIATLEEYLAAKEGFAVKYDDGRLWVFRAGSKEWEDFQKQRELAKHVTRINAGPHGMTLKAPDTDTLDAYLKAESN